MYNRLYLPKHVHLPHEYRIQHASDKVAEVGSRGLGEPKFPEAHGLEGRDHGYLKVRLRDVDERQEAGVEQGQGLDHAPEGEEQPRPRISPLAQRARLVGEGAPHRRVLAPALPYESVDGGDEPFVAVLDVDVYPHVGEGLEDAAEGRDLAIVPLFPLEHQSGLGVDRNSPLHFGQFVKIQLKVTRIHYRTAGHGICIISL